MIAGWPGPEGDEYALAFDRSRAARLLILPPLFPWLKDALGASYTQLGFLMTIFFVVSCGVQAASGFLVDRFGPRPILFGGLALVAAAAFGFATGSAATVSLTAAAAAGVAAPAVASSRVAKTMPMIRADRAADTSS